MKVGKAIAVVGCSLQQGEQALQTGLLAAVFRDQARPHNPARASLAAQQDAPRCRAPHARRASCRAAPKAKLCSGACDCDANSMRGAPLTCPASTPGRAPLSHPPQS